MQASPCLPALLRFPLFPFSFPGPVGTSCFILIITLLFSFAILFTFSLPAEARYTR